MKLIVFVAIIAFLVVITKAEGLFGWYKQGEADESPKDTKRIGNHGLGSNVGKIGFQSGGQQGSQTNPDDYNPDYGYEGEHYDGDNNEDQYEENNGDQYGSDEGVEYGSASYSRKRGVAKRSANKSKRTSNSQKSPQVKPVQARNEPAENTPKFPGAQVVDDKDAKKTGKPHGWKNKHGKPGENKHERPHGGNKPQEGNKHERPFHRPHGGNKHNKPVDNKPQDAPKPSSPAVDTKPEEQPTQLSKRSFLGPVVGVKEDDKKRIGNQGLGSNVGKIGFQSGGQQGSSSNNYNGGNNNDGGNYEDEDDDDSWYDVNGEPHKGDGEDHYQSQDYQEPPNNQYENNNWKGGNQNYGNNNHDDDDGDKHNPNYYLQQKKKI